MRNLYFKNSWGNRRLIAQCDNDADVIKAIHAFIAKCNERRPADNQFVIYYTRIWHENNMTCYDVGSWNEFFEWED